jgi:hypothetical protein
MTREFFLKAACSLALRLEGSAMWSGRACSWIVRTPDRKATNRHATIETASDGMIYQGTAGIGLFLSELSVLTGDARWRKLADGALAHAAAFAPSLPNTAFGMHSGRVGVAFALARHGNISRSEAHVKEALEILRPLYGNEERDTFQDVIGGAAGAIPALMQIAYWTGAVEPMRSAEALGWRAVSTARRQPVGWSWGLDKPEHARDLAGYAHGAAGFGHAFAELYRITRSDVFLYACSQAFDYEQTAFDEGLANWYDFRNSALTSVLRHPRPREELLARQARGEKPPYYVKCAMNAWCHGAPGIALARLRAFEIADDARWRTQAETAVSTTLATLAASANCSLCHGSFGNCETLLIASETLNRPELREAAEQTIAEAIERFEQPGSRWPSGVAGGLPDPSLMLGEAGVGHFLLRLCSDTVPSILRVDHTASSAIATGGLAAFMTAPRNETGVRIVDVATLRREHRELLFGRTIQAMRALGQALPDSQLSSLVELDADPGQWGRAFDCARLLESDERIAMLMADASSVEFAAWDLESEIDLPGRQAIDSLLNYTLTVPDWTLDAWRLRPNVRVVRTSIDWDRYLETGSGALPTDEDDEQFYVVVRREQRSVARSDRRTIVRRIDRFAGLVLLAIESATPADMIAETLSRFVADPVEMAPKLKLAVHRQLLSALQAGLVDRLRVVKPERGSVKVGAM